MRRGGRRRARLRSGGTELRRANAPARKRDRKGEGVGEVPLTTAKLWSGDVVEEAERNSGTAASWGGGASPAWAESGRPTWISSGVCTGSTSATRATHLGQRCGLARVERSSRRRTAEWRRRRALPGEAGQGRGREEVGEVPLTTAKLRSSDVVEETERNGGELRT